MRFWRDVGEAMTEAFQRQRFRDAVSFQCLDGFPKVYGRILAWVAR